MMDWWNAMTGLERFFALVAIPSTLLLIIQTVLMLFGLGHGHDGSMETDHSGLGHDGGFDHDHDFDHGFDHDHDFDHDGMADHDHDHEPHDPSLRIFTVRGMVAFFCIFGWCGLACLQGDIGVPFTLTVAFIAGLAAMLSIALLLKAALKLQSDGTVSLSNAVGKSALVYIRVPAKRAERGKVNVTVQECYVEADAVTDDETDLPPGHEVTVVGLANQNTLLVAAKTPVYSAAGGRKPSQRNAKK